MTGRVIAVAYSGGRDSTALLHATFAQAAAHEVQVLALHVHHGLSPHADAWLSHCAEQCRRWSEPGRPLEFVAHRLAGRPSRGESAEAWARKGRYEQLRAMALARGVNLILLAHHRRDQAETVLLQALRGAGTAGLAGMPREVQRNGITWLRPWLDKEPGDIDAYVRRHRLAHIEDDSNADPRFARSRLRVRVWPALTQAFEHAEAALAATAEWAQQAGAALHELAMHDLTDAADGDGLLIDRWKLLSPARRSNALRAWVGEQAGSNPPATLTIRLLDELPVARSARWSLGQGELQLHRGMLRYARSTFKAAAAEQRETHLEVRRAGIYRLPGWAGRLRIERVREGGVPFAWLARLELRARLGAEQFQAGIDRPARSLKKQYQGAGMPAWQRVGPLVYSGGQLVFVPGLGIDARVIAVPGQAQARLTWLPLDDAG